MPTNQDDDVELSAMLNQAEPPKSPRHVDEAILKYAREKASETGTARGNGLAFLNIDWLHRNWVSAAATLSIAVLAVSLSLQTFDEPNSSSKTVGGGIDFASNESIAEPAAIETAALGQTSGNTAPQSDAVSDAAAPNAAARQTFSDANTAAFAAPPVVETAARREQEEQIAAAPTTARTAITGQLQSAGNQTTGVDADRSNGDDIALASADVSDAVVEEVFVTGAAVRRSAASAAASSQQAQTSLTDAIAEDPALLLTVITVLGNAMGLEVQPPAADQEASPDQLNVLIAAYHEVSDATTLADIENRYAAARVEAQESRLPVSVEELVNILVTEEL